MKKISISQWLTLFVLLAFLFNACSTSSQNATPTEASPTETFTPESTETNTVTPEPTSTPKPEFNICTPENFKDCPITVDTLFDGTYLAWLNTLSKPFDPTKILTDVQMMNFGNIYLIYQHKGLFMGSNAGKEPFRRDVTAGYVSFGGHDYIVMPIEFYDSKDPHTNQWVITVNNFGGGAFGDPNDSKEQQRTIDAWRRGMNITAIVPTATTPDTKTKDPLAQRSFDIHQDLDVRIGAFVGYNGYGKNYKGWKEWPTKGPDMTALNAPGIVLLNMIDFSIEFNKTPDGGFQ